MNYAPAQSSVVLHGNCWQIHGILVHQRATVVSINDAFGTAFDPDKPDAPCHCGKVH